MNFYQQPYSFGQQPFIVGQPMIPQPQLVPTEMMGPIAMNPNQPRREEQSYIENILRLNIGKVATVYMNFEGSQWGSKIFKGYILAAGRDHLILQDLQSETRYLLLMVYLDYVTFEGEIEYDYPFRNKKKEKNS
ncbi:MAG: spore coat protein GerQ [Bacilli bacterium]|nr:spore coat protein GerQ [Bacilli bacterium]